MKVKFTCPKCGSNTGVEEVLDNVWQFSTVTDIEGAGPEEDPIIDYGNISYESDEESRVHEYRCIECGHSIAADANELMTFLKQHNMLE